MRSLVAIAISGLALGGCQIIFGFEEGSPVEETEGCVSFETHHIKSPCDLGPPGPALTLDNSIIDTDAETLSLGLGGDNPEGLPFVSTIDGQRVLWVENFVIQQGLTVTGSEPLFVLADDEIIVEGRITRSAVGNGDCETLNDAGAGGGGGGGFQGRGGVGGFGFGGSVGGGAGGTPLPVPLDGPRSGCPGEGVDVEVSAAGLGGGAVQLSARNRIVISGIVIAAGEGGRGGVEASGGGGGGSGGYIGLDAPTIRLGAFGHLFANGGGGGGGGGDGANGGDFGEGGSNGNRGSSNPTSSGEPGRGGGLDEGTSGGIGSFGDVLEGGDVTEVAASGSGGGGGGGGAGYVLLFTDPDPEVPGPTSPPHIQVTE